MKIFIDADYLVYAAGFRYQYPHPIGESGLWTLVADGNRAKEFIDDSVASLCRMFDTDDMHLALTGSSDECYRKNFWPEYKAHRNAFDKVPCLLRDELRKYLCEKYEAVITDKIEADDLVSMWATEDEDSVVVSPDKDLRTTPCFLYNPQGQEGPVWVTEETANRNLLLQAIVGDKADNYPGIPGVGPVTAVKHFDKNGWTWENFFDLFKKKGYTYDYAINMLKCAYLLRFGNYNNGEIYFPQFEKLPI